VVCVFDARSMPDHDGHDFWMLAVNRTDGLIESLDDFEDSGGNLVPAGDTILVGRFYELAHGNNPGNRRWKLSPGADQYIDARFLVLADVSEDLIVRRGGVHEISDSTMNAIQGRLTSE